MTTKIFATGNNRASRHFQIDVLQNEISAWRFGQSQRELCELAAEQGIPVLAYRPLNDGHHSPRSRGTKMVDRLADAHGLTREQLRSQGPEIVPLFGATRMTSVKSTRAAVEVTLDTRSAPETNHEVVLPRDTSDILIVMGIQGSGKSDYVREFVDAGYQRLNRDLRGGSLRDLIPELKRLLAAGRNRVVLDNTYPTAASRADIIAAAKTYRIPVRCLHIRTPLAEAQKNVVLRMISKYGMPLGPAEMEFLRKQDSNLPPPQALMRWLQTFERPSHAEGFAEVIEQDFVRRENSAHTNRGLLLDVDGTVRRTVSGNVFPRHPDDVELLPGRTETLQRWFDDGYQLFFVSNQGGIAANMVSHQAVQAAMHRTVELLGLPVAEITYCSHPARPVQCFCRKPMPGLGVYLRERHQLDPDQCLMVGEMETDQQFAENLGV